MEEINLSRVLSKLGKYRIRETNSNQVKGLKQRLHNLEEQKASLDQVNISKLLQQRREPTHSYDKYGHDAFCWHQRQSRTVNTQVEFTEQMIDAAIRGDYGALTKSPRATGSSVG